jgi:hypothetical protein
VLERPGEISQAGAGPVEGTEAIEVTFDDAGMVKVAGEIADMVEVTREDVDERAGLSANTGAGNVVGLGGPESAKGFEVAVAVAGKGRRDVFQAAVKGQDVAGGLQVRCEFDEVSAVLEP